MRTSILLIALVLILASCGGGGGGTPTPPEALHGYDLLEQQLADFTLADAQSLLVTKVIPGGKGTHSKWEGQRFNEASGQWEDITLTCPWAYEGTYSITDENELSARILFGWSDFYGSQLNSSPSMPFENVWYYTYPNGQVKVKAWFGVTMEGGVGAYESWEGTFENGELNGTWQLQTGDQENLEPHGEFHVTRIS